MGVVILIILYVSLFGGTFEVLTNRQSPMVEGSKTENENATEALLKTELPESTAERAQYSCRNTTGTACGGNGNLCAWCMV